MPRLPGAEELGNPVSGRSGRPVATYDGTALARGAQALGAGIASFGADVGAIEQSQKAEVSKEQAFETQRRFLEFSSAQDEALINASQKAEPGAFGFRESYQQEYMKSAKDFFNTVPDELKGQYDSKLFAVEDQLSGKALTFERDQRKSYYSAAVNDGLTKIENDLYANPDNFTRNLTEGNNYIDALPDDVTPIEKEALKREWRKKAQLASLNGMPAESRLQALGVAGGEVAAGSPASGGREGAKAFLRKAEGFRESPYWDVNAFRTGYGSDTITRPDGSIVKVEKGMTVTRQEAEADLDRRIVEFERGVVGDVGSDTWASVPPAAQSALLSVAYNYGSLPKDVATAVRSGDMEAVAAAVENRGSDNNGVNKSRRANEASVIRGERGIPASGEVAPEYADMSYVDREKVVAGAQTELKQQETAASSAAKANYTLFKDAMTLGIETGDVKTEAEILTSSLDDGDKATLLKALRSKNKEDVDVRDLVGAIVAGDKSASVNPFDADDRKTGDQAYEAMTKAVSEEQAPAITETFIRETGYIPKTIQADIRQGAEAKDPATLSQALSRADALSRIAPISFEAIDGGKAMRDKAAMYSHFVNDLGMSGPEAAQRILRMDDAAVKVNREVLKPEAAKFTKTLAVSDVTDAFDPGFFSREPGAGAMPIQANGLLAEYRELAESSFYETGGDEEAAKALALSEIKKRWNVSNVTGSPQLMRMPPELHYPAINDDHTYLRDDAMKTAQEYVSDNFEGREVENVALLATSETRADIEMGRPPRYRLFYQYVEDGQTKFDEVFAGLWGIETSELKAGVIADKASKRDLFVKERERNSQINQATSDAQAAAQEEVRRIQDMPISDTVKAARTEAAQYKARLEEAKAKQKAKDPDREERLRRDEEQRQEFLARDRKRIGNFMRGGITLPGGN